MVVCFRFISALALAVVLVLVVVPYRAQARKSEKKFSEPVARPIFLASECRWHDPIPAQDASPQARRPTGTTPSGRILIKIYDHNHVGSVVLGEAGQSLRLAISGPLPSWRVIRDAQGVETLEINVNGRLPAFFRGPNQLLAPKVGRFRMVHLMRASPWAVRLTVRHADPAGQLGLRLVPQGTSRLGWLLVSEGPPAATVPKSPKFMEAKQGLRLPNPEPAVSPGPELAVSSPQPTVADFPKASPSAVPQSSLSSVGQGHEDSETEFPSRLMLGGQLLGLKETLPDVEGASPFIAPQPGELPISVRTLYWQHRVLPTWSTEVDVRWWDTYTVVDELDNSDRHSRDEGWLRLGVSRNLKFHNWLHRPFVGLEVRGVLVKNNRKALVREYLFANSQWYASPFVGTSVTIPIWGPLSGFGQVTAQPIFSLLEDRIALAEGISSADAGTLEQLPFLVGGAGELGVEATSDRWVARISYRYQLSRSLQGEFQTLNSTGLSLGYRY